MIFRSRFFPHIERTSRLGFGTATLVGLDSATERERLFSTAFDAGINHFDTAPYYGYGAAEAMLGSLIRGRRHEVSIATKFGIQPPRALKNRFVNRFARRVLKEVPQLRNLLSKGAQASTARGAFAPEDARRSLEASLRALNTSYIDLFLLHEPGSSDAQREDLIAFLNEQVRTGKIRAFGCGGDFDGIRAVAEASVRTHQYFQFEDSLLHPNRQTLAQNVCSITYRCLATIPGLLAERHRRNPLLLKQWNDELDCDCSSTSVLGRLLVGAALDRNCEGLVLVSSTKIPNLEAAVSGASDVPAHVETVRRFWELASVELSRTENHAASNV